MLLKEAGKLFKEKNFEEAYKLYKKAALRYGELVVSYHLKKCEESLGKKLSKIQEEIVTEKKIIDRTTFPIPEEKSILLQANRLMNDGLIEEGLVFAKENAEGEVAEAIELLYANKEFDNEVLWLKHINKYLKQFEITPISLTKNGFSRFHCITSLCDYTINEGPLVTVIMPAYNAQDYLEHSIESILNQTWRNLEIIIIDDCSDDRTWDILKQMALQDDRIKIFKNKINVGPYVSKNIALKMSTGSYVTGHDADDWAHPQRIENHVKYMIEHKKIKASATKMLRMDKEGLADSFSKINAYTNDGITRLASISTMFESSFLKKTLGGWDSVRFGADSELIARCKIILKDEFIELNHLSMICLDAVGSLTNDSEHGVKNGISDIRKYFRDNFVQWHKTLNDNVFLPFPHEPRMFKVSEAAYVPLEDILTNLKNIHTIESKIKQRLKLKEKLSFQTLDQLECLKEKNALRFNYKTDSFKYECLWQQNSGEYLFVLFHGAKDRTKIEAPFFERWTWNDLYPGSMLNISDPSLDLDKDLRLAWYIGNKDEYPVKVISKIVARIAEVKNIDTKKIIFYGSSGAGFTALAASRYIKGSIAVAINAQTNVLKYYKSHISDMLKMCLGNISEEKMIQKYNDRIDMVDAYSGDIQNKVLILQNTEDPFHYNNHYLPFINKCKAPEKGGVSSNGLVKSFLYTSEKGHGPESKEMVSDIIHMLKEWD